MKYYKCTVIFAIEQYILLTLSQLWVVSNSPLPVANFYVCPRIIACFFLLFLYKFLTLFFSEKNHTTHLFPNFYPLYLRIHMSIDKDKIKPILSNFVHYPMLYLMGDFLTHFHIYFFKQMLVCYFSLYLYI